MKILMIAIVALLITCGGRDMTNKNSSHKYNKICLDGFVYYNSGDRLAIKLTKWGNPVKCKVKKK